MVVTGSEHAGITRYTVYIVHTVHLDNGKSHARQWKLSSRIQVVQMGYSLKAPRPCPECRTVLY